MNKTIKHLYKKNNKKVKFNNIEIIHEYNNIQPKQTVTTSNETNINKDIDIDIDIDIDKDINKKIYFCCFYY
jgi:hypothetical protein